MTSAGACCCIHFNASRYHTAFVVCAQKLQGARLGSMISALCLKLMSACKWNEYHPGISVLLLLTVGLKMQDSPEHVLRTWHILYLLLAGTVRSESQLYCTCKCYAKVLPFQVLSVTGGYHGGSSFSQVRGECVQVRAAKHHWQLAGRHADRAHPPSRCSTVTSQHAQ